MRIFPFMICLFFVLTAEFALTGRTGFYFGARTECLLGFACVIGLRSKREFSLFYFLIAAVLHSILMRPELIGIVTFLYLAIGFILFVFHSQISSENAIVIAVFSGVSAFLIELILPFISIGNSMSLSALLWTCACTVCATFFIAKLSNFFIKKRERNRLLL